MTETQRITQQELQPLPRWARLALTARCLRRARELVRAPTEQAGVLDEALARIEQASGQGRAGDELADAAAAAYTLALDRLDQKAPVAEPDEAVVVVCMVAHATAFAAEAATLPDARTASHLLAQSIDFAVHAFRLARQQAGPEVLAAMRADLTQLREAAQRQGWSDETPVRS